MEKKNDTFEDIFAIYYMDTFNYMGQPLIISEGFAPAAGPHWKISGGCICGW